MPIGDCTGWNIDTIKEHFEALLLDRDRYLATLKSENDRHFEALIAENDRRYEERASAQQVAMSAALAAQEKAVAAAMSAANQAVLKAESANEKRFEGVNEFRSTLADQQRTLLPRAEAEVSIKALVGTITDLSSRVSALEGLKAGGAQGWGFAVGAIGVVAAVVAILSRFLK